MYKDTFAIDIEKISSYPIYKIKSEKPIDGELLLYKLTFGVFGVMGVKHHSLSEVRDNEFLWF